MKSISAIVLSTFLGFAGCAVPDAEEGVRGPGALAGTWRGVLASPGGELPFTLEIRWGGGALSAVAVNGLEEAPFSAVDVDGGRVTFALDFYDAEIEAELGDGGNRLEGRWRKTVPGGDSTLPFAAVRGDRRRFLPPAEAGLEGGAAAAVPSVEGAWVVEFSDEDGTEPARAELRQEGSRVTGTFLTPTGDYRYLAGGYEEGLLRLSTFDGAHAFLFAARAREDGTLAGDFYSRDTYHATWTARSAGPGDEALLPDAWELVGLTNDDGSFSFAFPDLEGEMVSLADERFAGKVVVVNVFGSWCPNCNDEAPLLADWHRRFSEDGLELVGLAYELSGDPERDRTFVAKFAARYRIEYPLLLAGTSDKAQAAATLPDLTSVVAFPTTIFIGRDGKVRKIHSGFSGPGTGPHYGELVGELEGLLRELLAESA